MTERTLRVTLAVTLVKQRDRDDSEWRLDLKWPVHRPVPVAGDVIWFGNQPIEVQRRHQFFTLGEADVELVCEVDDIPQDGTAWFLDLCRAIEASFPSIMTRSTRKCVAKLAERNRRVADEGE